MTSRPGEQLAGGVPAGAPAAGDVPAGAPGAWEALSDEELAAHCASELGACLTELVGRYEHRIRDCARRMSLDRAGAEDLVGEIYLRLVVSLPEFQARSAFSTWLYRLAHNTCVDAFRRERRWADRSAHPAQSAPDYLLAEIPAAWGDPVADLDAGIRECYLGQALARLPGDYRQVVLLRLGEGRSNEEVAQALGISVDAVKARLRRARRRLVADLTERRRCPLCQRLGELGIGAGGEVG